MMLAALALAGTLTGATVHPNEVGAYEAQLTKQASETAENFAGAPCADVTIKRLSSQAVKINDHPEVPALREKLAVAGCGHSLTVNVNVGRMAGAPPWLMVAGLPGETLADMTLQQSAWPAAVTQARVELPEGCTGQRVDDVYVAARPGHVDAPAPSAPAGHHGAGWFNLRLPETVESQRQSLDLSKAWVEIWPIELCGQDRTTGVVFIPLRGRPASAYIFLPIWRQIAEHGLGARPAPAPRSD
ncbi:MAG: hypothetical protein E7812_06070 [Phenylobacterium sp.]|nr:MAG: hypothetical protein E7812_06070 [Phenylobacterium sp.]